MSKSFVLLSVFTLLGSNIIFGHKISFANYPLPDQSISKKDSLPDDTVHVHSWKKATIWSACLPGSGQIYNEFGYRKVQQKKHRAWWKVPIIYAGLGATGYYFYDYYKTAQSLKLEWLYRNNNGGAMSNPEYFLWSDEELLSGKTANEIYYPGYDFKAKYRDLFAIGFIAVWGLNVAEALVDGHFVNFDVSEDLSFHWCPILLTPNSPGMSFGITF